MKNTRRPWKGNVIFFFIIMSFGIADKALAQDNNEEQNKKIVTRYFDEVINKRKIELLDDFFSESYVLHSLNDGSETKGVKHLKDYLPAFFRTFPDFHCTIDEIISEDNNVVIQLTGTGTQIGEFRDYPISHPNNKFKIAEVFFFKIEDKKIVEGKRLMDLLSLDKQLRGHH